MHPRIVPLLALVLLAACPAFAADLPTWKLSELKTLSGWSQPAAEDGHNFRTAAAGRSAVMTVPIWWGKEVRAPENTVYMLKISYKDTVSKPAVFYAHAGRGSYWGLSEIHRFGGAGDDKWKTAQVPLSWDLVMRKNVPGDVTELAINAEKDLPVESIEVSLAGKDAAGRYFEETRAWVAKAQAAKKASADMGPKQQAELGEAWKDKALVPYPRTYLTEVYPNSAPQKGEAGATLKLRMAQNEYESAAFGVYANGKELKAVTFSLSPLAGEAGELACEVEAKTAEYSAVKAGGGRSTSAEAQRYRLYPQRFWPAWPVEITANRSQWFLVTLHTLGAKSKPGLYKGSVKITAEGAAAELPVEVEVLPVTLLTMQQAGLELGGCGFATQQELRDLAAHNHTGMDIWFGGAQQQMTTRAGKLSMDFYYLDDFMGYAAKKCNMTHMMWFMGGDPYGYPDTVNLERDLYCSQPGERAALRREYIAKSNESPDKVLPGLRELYVQWVQQTAEHAKKNGWPKLIIHPFDEPAKYVQSTVWDNPFAKVKGTGPWIKEHFMDAAALIRQGAKGYDNILVGGDMHHAAPSMTFVENKTVDVFCTNAIHEDAQLGEKVRAAGIQFWQYSGTGDSTPAHRPRYTFGFFFGAYNSTGFLVWAYDAGRRFDTSEGDNWCYGWYTPFGTAETPFVLGIREGLDDRRWVETYKKLVGADKAKEVLDPIFAEAVGQRAAGGRNTVTDFWAEVQQLEKVDIWRNKIVEAVLKAGK